MEPIEESPQTAAIAAAVANIERMIEYVNRGETVATHELEALAAPLRALIAPPTQQSGPVEEQASAAGAAS